MKRVLFVAGHEFLYSPQNGGQKCSMRNYRLMQNICGKENVFLSIFSNHNYNNLTKQESVFPTQKNQYELLINTLFLRNVCSRKVMKQFINYVNSLEIDFIFVDSSTIGYLLKRTNLEIPMFFFFHNIERNYAWNKVKHEGVGYLVAFFSYYVNELIATKIAKKIILLNKRDEGELIKHYGRKADFILPITFEDTFDESKAYRKQEENIKLLFVGSKFAPNVEGIKWFINNVMTRLPANMELQIVGKDLEQERNNLQRENVNVIGTVSDLAEYYYQADAVVIPIFYGDGMKVKTAEAMMYGKRIFATTEALEGYEIENVSNIYRCNSAEEFANAICNNAEWDCKCNTDVRTQFLKRYETLAIRKNFGEFVLSDL